MTGVVSLEAGAFRPALLGGEAALALLLVAAMVAFWVRGLAVARLEDENEALKAAYGQVTAVNAANAATMETLRAEKFVAEMAVSMKETEAGKLRAHNSVLQRQLREAAKHEENLDRLVARGIADALCLQHAAASGNAVRGGSADPAAGTDARAAHTAARCAGWRELTYRDVVEYTGVLLEHAGLERADKRALRFWAEKQ